MRKLQHTEVRRKIHIRIQAQPGASLDDCQREAALLCLEEMQTVSMRHNDREYVYRPIDIMELRPNPKRGNDEYIE